MVQNLLFLVTYDDATYFVSNAQNEQERVGGVLLKLRAGLRVLPRKSVRALCVFVEHVVDCTRKNSRDIQNIALFRIIIFS